MSTFKLWDFLSPREQAQLQLVFGVRPPVTMNIESSEEIGKLMKQNQGVLIGGKK